MKNRTALAAFFAAMILFTGDASAGKLRIAATTEDLASIAREVGGDYVEVDAIARGYQDPHYVAAKPSYMKKLNKADLLLFNGLQLEIGWLPLLIEGSRNSEIAPGTPGNLPVSGGVRILEVPEGGIDRSQGDIHPEGNPHYVLDPRNGLIIADTIRDRLSALDPEHSEAYAANAGAFRRELEEAIAEWTTRAEPLRGARIVAFHKQWEYLVDWLGFEIIDYIEPQPGIPPSPKHLAALNRSIPAEGVRFILAANFVEPKSAEKIAKDTGIPLLIVPASVRGEDGIDTYFDLFDLVVNRISSAVRPVETRGMPSNAQPGAEK